jgi:predicted KAP-like P-loop ATPase
MKQRGGKLATISEQIDSYGELLSPLSIIPFLGPWIERLRGGATSMKKYQERRKGGVGEQRKKLSESLAKLPTPLIVVIDDIDRLHSQEIRDIFKLVRLTANFPNVIYVLAFDRTRVEKALAEDSVDGRAYLEKIVQSTFDVPAIPSFHLQRQLLEELDKSIDSIELHVFDDNRWPDVLVEIIFPLIHNMRDVRRYTSSIRSATRSLRGQIDLVDILALESLRVFLPDVLSDISQNRETMTHPRLASLGMGRRDTTQQVAHI